MNEDSDRIERLLALLLIAQMKGSNQRDKIHQLSLAGFSNVEIANILGTSAATVSQSLYEVKSAKGRKKPSPKSGRKSTPKD